LGRNSLLGPNFRQLDFSIFKNTPITERLKMELRFEAYNLINHPNFANPYLPAFFADGAPNGFDSTGRALGSLGLGVTGDVGVGYPYLGSGGAVTACGSSCSNPQPIESYRRPPTHFGRPFFF
jgi:hypothetical protein